MDTGQASESQLKQTLEHPLDPDDVEAPTTSIGERVYRALRRRILNGEAEQGVSISANALATEMGVSRTPVREALARLHSDKLLEKSTTGRLVPVVISYSKAADLFVTRAANEGMAARLAANAAESTQVESLLRLCTEAWESFENQQRSRLVEQNHQFHTELLRIADTEGLTQAIEHSDALIYKYRQATLMTPERVRRSLHTHDEIVRLIIARRVDEVERVARNHVYAAGRVFIDAIAAFMRVDRETPSSLLIKFETQGWGDL